MNKDREKELQRLITRAKNLRPFILVLTIFTVLCQIICLAKDDFDSFFIVFSNFTGVVGAFLFWRFYETTKKMKKIVDEMNK